jgi:hypothetical protein
MRALSLWFSVSSGEDASVLSTGPSDPATHWRQTSIAFGKDIFLNLGDSIGVDVGIESPGGAHVTDDAPYVGNRSKILSVSLFNPSKGQ